MSRTDFSSRFISGLFGWFGRGRKIRRERSTVGEQILAVLFDSLCWDIVQGSDLSDRFSFEKSEDRPSFIMRYAIRERIIDILKVEVNPDSAAHFVLVTTGVGSNAQSAAFAYIGLNPRALHQHCFEELRKYGFSSEARYAVRSRP